MIKNSDREDLRRSQPHFAESVRLKKEIQLLKELLKTEDRISARLEIKKRISLAKTNLTRELVYQRLHREGKGSLISKVRSQILSWGAKLENRSERAERQIRFFLHMKIPPSAFSLNSLYASEKGSDIKEWVRNRQSRERKPRKKTFANNKT